MENVGDFEDDEVAGLECQAWVLMQASFHLFTESVMDKHFSAELYQKHVFITSVDKNHENHVQFWPRIKFMNPSVFT